MLVLSRHKDEVIWVNGVKVTVVALRGDKVRISIDAARDIPVHREELLQAIGQTDPAELQRLGYGLNLSNEVYALPRAA